MAKRSTNPDPNLPVPVTTGGLDSGPGMGSGLGSSLGPDTAPLAGAPEASGPAGGLGATGTGSSMGSTMGTTGTMGTMGGPQEGSQGDRNAAQRTKDEARNLMDQAKRETSKLADQARSQVRDQVQGLVAERKDQMANRLGSLAGALRDVGQRLNEQDGGGFGQYADRAAQQVDRISSYLRDRDLDNFVRDTETFARRRPELFLGGTFLAGMLVARFLKASSERQERRRYQEVHRAGGSPYDDAGYDTGYGTGGRMGSTYEDRTPGMGAPEPYNPTMGG